MQFVDGDCEIDPGWLDRGLRELEARPDVAVVCGRRRERYPQASDLQPPVRHGMGHAGR